MTRDVSQSKISTFFLACVVFLNINFKDKPSGGGVCSHRQTLITCFYSSSMNINRLPADINHFQ